MTSIVTLADGTRRKLKPGEVVPDGASLHVAMSFADARQTAALAAIHDRPLVVDGFGRRAGHRPGFAFATDAKATEARQAALDDYQRWLRDAWKGPEAAEAATTASGDQTVPRRSLVDAEAIKAVAYDEMRADLANRWRGDAT